MQAYDGCGKEKIAGSSCYCVPVSKRKQKINTVDDNTVNNNALVIRILVEDKNIFFY